MDPTSARLLDDLKDLLREKVITLTEWRSETAAVHARALAQQALPTAPPAAPPAAPPTAPPTPTEPAPGAGKNARKNAKKRAAKKAKGATAPAASAEAAAPPAQAPALTDEDVYKILADAGFGPDVLQWRVVRNFANQQQPRLRDSMLVVPDDHPSAEDPRQFAVEVNPLTVERLAADRTDHEALGAVLRGRDWDAVVDMSAYHPPDVAIMVELLDGSCGHYVFASSTVIYAASDTLPITEDQVWRAARIEADLALAGETIGSADTWIAAAALETGLPVLTQNTRHFTRIPGVQVIGYSILP